MNADGGTQFGPVETADKADAPGLLRRGGALLLGERFIDLPIRVFALFLASTALTPGAAESDAPLYRALFYASSLLFVAGAFAPGRSAMVGVLLYLAHLLAFPEFMNPFQESLEFSAAVLLAFGRWRAWVVLCATIVGLTLASQSIQPGVVVPLSLLAVSAGLGGILGLSAWALERRIQREIARREAAAVAHEQETQRLRVRFAVDTHDTLSHSLATQAAIVRVLAKQTGEQDVRTALGELAMVNETAQQNLRTLLTRLQSVGGPGAPTTMSRAELVGAVESVVSAAEAGGYVVGLDVEGLPPRLDSVLCEQLVFLARELVTNIVKHSSSCTDCCLSVTMQTDEFGTMAVILEASNPAAAVQAALPRSLAQRVASLGGACTTEVVAGRFTVTVELSWRTDTTQSPPDEG